MTQTLIKKCTLFIVLFNLMGCRCISKTAEAYKDSLTDSISSYTMSGTMGISETTEKIADYTNYSLSSIVNCGQGIVRDTKSLSLFAAENDGEEQIQSLSDLNFSGWNHTTNDSVAEWTNLKLGSSNYNFNDRTKVNSSCNRVNTLDMILLKKIANWDHQHSNGFECNMLAQGLKFGDIENLVLDLKINSAKTNIPSVESLKTIYANYINEDVVNALEDGKVNIGITLGDSTNLNGSIIFQLDQEILSDKWVRVTIPMNKLSFYNEINYKQSPKMLADLSNVIIKRMLIVGETKSGAVLRNNINSWNKNIPETFKEMNLSFKKIELQLK